jgi:hypothetical protein
MMNFLEENSRVKICNNVANKMAVLRLPTNTRVLLTWEFEPRTIRQEHKPCMEIKKSWLQGEPKVKIVNVVLGPWVPQNI